MKETLGIVPQVFYDLIGRVVPGVALLVVGGALLTDRTQARAAASALAGLPATVLFFLFVVALVASYLVGVLLGAIGFVFFEHRRYRTTKFTHLSQDVPIGRLKEPDLPYVYDLILVQNPAAGTRLVKLRAEGHLCRVLIIGCALLMVLYLIQQRNDMTPAVGYILLVLAFAAAAAYLFQRHLRVRVWLLQINCWNILNSATPARPPTPVPEVTPAAHSLVRSDSVDVAASHTVQTAALLIETTTAETRDQAAADL